MDIIDLNKIRENELYKKYESFSKEELEREFINLGLYVSVHGSNGGFFGEFFEDIPFLIFKMDIEKTESLIKSLSYFNNLDIKEIEDMFKARDIQKLNNHLEKELSSNGYKQKKIKI